MKETSKYRVMYKKMINDQFHIHDHMPHKGITVMRQEKNGVITFKSIKYSGDVVDGNLLRGE